MTEAAVEPTIRQLVRASTPEEFAKDHSKAELQEIASSIGIAIEDLKGTKAEITAVIYTKYPPPDPTLRGKSTASSPVAEVWAHAETRFGIFRNGESEKPRRCDVVEECKANGIAHFTARTQYQAWFSYTGGGEREITPKSDGLPKGLGVLLGFPQPEPVKEEPAEEK